jgi:hypothetical protein
MKKKQIIPNEQNLLKALRACAKAHKAQFFFVGEERQAVVLSADIPATSDICAIVRAFADYPTDSVWIDKGWFTTTIVLSALQYREEVDTITLSLALPYGKRVRYATA